ncbi:PDR/VanB family oxidoreductase [Novosphingobium sp. 9]|uniref:PDR/VanB family oxidoreductase n=1 Tax=Novosphingobium sp. 9 TaxID=2025349 RepID=UPI0021B5D9F8|nr:PDR/VanB family oxidoreductase [Novosphingobium sp. 9]
MSGEVMERSLIDLKPGWMRAQVVAIRQVTPSIREFTLILPQAVSAQPGSHVRIGVDIAGRSDERSYSVVAHEGAQIRIAVKRQPESRGGSAFMWRLEEGDALALQAPRCDFPLMHGAPHYLLMAGGVGVTPMVAMAHQLALRGASLRMVYAARDADEFAYGEELAALLGDRFARFDAAAGHHLDLAAEIAALPQGSELYMCGPLGLMDAVRAVWGEAGRPLEKLRFETFGSSGAHAAQAFTVKVPRLGTEIAVRENESMLDALEAAGVEVVFECRRGECGLCAVDIVSVEGAVDHRDVFFSPAQHRENARMCACVSRVAGDSVTIDPAWRGDDAFSFAGAGAAGGSAVPPGALGLPPACAT